MSDIVWVEGDWAKVEVGQRARVVDGAGSIEGIVESVGGHVHTAASLLIKFGTGASSRVYSHSGSTLYVEAPPKVELPTEPGWYRGYDQLAEVAFVTELRDGKFWRGHYGTGEYGDVERFAPFTRLEPVAETAKKVLDRVAAVAKGRAGNPWNAGATLSAVAAEFGVTS